MLAEQWLKSTQMVKIRNKLPDWNRQDILNLALQEFSTTDLTKVQLAKLIDALKEPKTKKPVVAVELRAEEQVSELEEPVVFKPNKGKLGKQTEWLWNSGSFGLLFKDPQDVTKWALKLILGDTTRSNWNSLVGHWNHSTKYRWFTPELFKANLSPQAQKILTRKNKEEANLKLPLPDNDTIRKRYWSLSEGDLLSRAEEQAEIVNVRVNIDGPPTITLKMKNGRSKEVMQYVSLSYTPPGSGNREQES